MLNKLGIKKPVLFAGLNWQLLSAQASKQTVTVTDLPRYPGVQRDIAMIVPAGLAWSDVQKTVHNIRLDKLQEIKLFDIFESEKLGTGKKSMAINFTFLDREKTLTDKEIDGWMNKIMIALEADLQAEIRK